MEPRFDAPHRADSPARSRNERQTGSDQGNGLSAGNAARRRRIVRGDANRAHRAQCLQPGLRVALAGTGLGSNTGPTRLVSRDGRSRADDPDQGWRSVKETPGALGRDTSGIVLLLVLQGNGLWKRRRWEAEIANRLHTESRRGGFDCDAPPFGALV